MVWFKHLTASARRVERKLFETTKLSIPQKVFLDARESEVCWRDANQLGKSYAIAYDTVAFARGCHPIQTHNPPVQIAVIGTSWVQMEPLMEKIWKLLPKSEISPRNGFVAGFGITGKPPRINFVAGPGKGSLIRFATYEQGPGRIAGATLHRLYCDEPPPEMLIGELRPRLLHNQGHIKYGFTPTPKSPPLGYFRKSIKEGIVREINFTLKEEYCIPEGFPRPWLYQHEIDAYEAKLLEPEREMRMGRAWEAVLTGAVLRGFSDQNIVAFDLHDDLNGWGLAIGIDHGTDEGKQAFSLLAFDVTDKMRPKIAVVDEFVTDGFITTPEKDAESILMMLRRNGLKYNDIDLWVGDRSAQRRDGSGRKSNSALRSELALQTNIHWKKTKWIYTPKKYPGSVLNGFSMMNILLLRTDEVERPHFMVHPRCQNFIKACREFTGESNHPLKDILDCVRYPIERMSGNVKATLVAHY